MPNTSLFFTKKRMKNTWTVIWLTYTVYNCYFITIITSTIWICQGWEFALWFFMWNALVTLFKRATRAIPSFTKSKKSNDSLFCFGYKKGKHVVKRMNLKRITLKKSKLLFHKELSAPVTLYLIDDIHSRCSFCKEQLLPSLFLKVWQEPKSEE